jgi:hypothetical protein
MKRILTDTSMRLHPISESGLFNPRILAAFVLCSVGVVLGMFGLAATPAAEVAGRNATAPPTLFRPDQLATGFAPRARALPPRMPLPPSMASSPRDTLGAPFSVNQLVDSLSSRPTAGFSSMPLSSTAAGRWSIVTSPNTGAATTTFAAVTCVSQSDCWAVGRSEIGGTNTNNTLLHWDGSSWQLFPAQSVPQVTNGLVSIACVSSSSCWAVGYTINIQTVQVQTLTLHWNGASWQIVPSPNVGRGFNALYGVACVSDSDCWAVGFENGGNLAQTLIERWDGTSWTVHDSPNVGTQHNVFNAVTCLSASNCWAVGYSGVAGAKNALVAHWDGTAWIASALPNQPLAQENTLYGVTCNSTSDCWAIGDSYNGTDHQTLVEQWQGTSWTSAVAPNGGVDNYLLSVTCASTSDCWAVGHSSNAAVDPQLVDQALFLHWNGTAWLFSPTAPDTSNATDLTGVACLSGSDCWAVGTLLPASPNSSIEPLMERWDGTSWTSVALATVAVVDSNFLQSVSCAGSADCWAAGFYFSGTVARSLTVHWDGTSWGVKDSPNTSMSRSNYLSDIKCVSSSDCWTVGSTSDNLGMANQALAMHWDGTAWSIVNPAPVDTSQQVETSFEAVSCASSSDCWAVGYEVVNHANQGFTTYQALIEQWNGTAWVVIPTPPQQNVPTLNSILYSVTCTSTSDCTGVGAQWSYLPSGNGTYQTIVDHWDGTSWSVVTSPNTASDQDNILSSVACASASDCWAVGSSGNYGQALVERWDGTSWSIVPSPQTGNILNAVTCLSASDCWAAGPYYTPNPPARTLLMHWDGAAWTKVSSPNTSATESNNLSGVTCTSSSNCWAVGEHWMKSSTKTLVLQYAPSPPLLSVVSRMLHRNAGTFDIDLTNGTGIECRSSATNGNYTLIFTFVNPLTSLSGASVTSGIGSVSSSNIDGSDAHNCVVNLTGVADAQVLTVSLSNVTDSAGNFSSAVSGSMGVLIGDTNGDGFVNSADISQTKSQSGQMVTSSNFREDVNTDGFINSGDISLVKSKSGTALP